MPEQGGSLTGIAAAREGVAALRAFWWLVVGLAIVGLLIGYLGSEPSGESKYRAWISTEELGANSSVTNLGISSPQGPQAADFLGEGILTRMEGSTGHDYDYLSEHLQVSQPPNGGPNPPIELIASAESEAAARSLLIAWMAAIRESRVHYVDAVLTRAETSLRKSLARARRRTEPGTQQEIAQLLARVQTTLRGTLSVDYVVQRKPKSYEEATVSRPREAVIGGIAGLIAGLVLALLISLAAGRLRTAEGVAAALDLELLTDLRSPQAVPSVEHARQRLRALGDGVLPSTLPLVPCGTPPAGADLIGALGEGIEAKVTGLAGASGLLSELERAGIFAIVAHPGHVRRADAAALRAELEGIGVTPAGLVVV